MEFDRTFTSSVYVVYNEKVLLHNHKKYNTLFPLGGKMKADEVPHETALREVIEESGLEVILYNNDNSLNLGKVVQLINPVHTLLENIGHKKENIDFIYFATAFSDEVRPQKGESIDLFWFTAEEIEENEALKAHVKEMALDALKTMKINNKKKM